MRALRTRRLFFAITLSATAIAVGCGGDDDEVNNNAENYEGTEAEVAQIVDDLANAGRDGDGTEICEEIFTPELADNIEREAGQSCAGELEDNLEQDEYELEIDSLELEGDTATVGTTDQEDRTAVLRMRQIDAAWRVVSFTPNP
jgi:hypothetical protein